MITHTLNRFTVSRLYEMREEINLNPKFQRRSGEWSYEDRSLLIDTIVRGFLIPEIFLADFRFMESGDPVVRSFAVVDGKQRLEAIFDFLDDDFKIQLPNGGSFPKGHLVSFSEIKNDRSDIAGRILSYELNVVVIRSDNLEDILETFRRLNRGKKISSMDIIKSYNTTVNRVVELVVKHPIFDYLTVMNYGETQELAIKVVAYELNGGPTDIDRRSLVRIASEPIYIDENIIYFKIAYNLDFFLDILQSLRYNIESYRSIERRIIERNVILRFPVYYWLVQSWRDDGQDLYGITRRLLYLILLLRYYSNQSKNIKTYPYDAGEVLQTSSSQQEIILEIYQQLVRSSKGKNVESALSLIREYFLDTDDSSIETGIHELLRGPPKIR